VAALVMLKEMISVQEVSVRFGDGHGQWKVFFYLEIGKLGDLWFCACLIVSF
jgi:hypothetical protein